MTFTKGETDQIPPRCLRETPAPPRVRLQGLHPPGHRGGLPNDFGDITARRNLIITCFGGGPSLAVACPRLLPTLCFACFRMAPAPLGRRGNRWATVRGIRWFSALARRKGAHASGWLQPSFSRAANAGQRCGASGGFLGFDRETGASLPRPSAREVFDPPGGVCRSILATSPLVLA